MDLLEKYDELPDEVKDILDSFDDNGDLYIEAERLKKELKTVGYTADYDLSGTLHSLKKL